MANEAGSIYAESDAFLYSYNDYFNKNTALINGGAISATTRSYFNIT